jgi:hypothetical protein
MKSFSQKMMLFFLISFFSISVAFASDKKEKVTEQPLTVNVLQSPIPVDTKEGKLLVYELNFLNPTEQMTRIGRIEISNEQGKLLESYEDVNLANNSFMYGKMGKKGSFTIHIGQDKEGKHQKGLTVKLQKKRKAKYMKQGSGFLELNKNMGAVVFVWIKLKDGQKVPKKLHHKIWLVQPSADNSHYQLKNLAYDVAVNPMKPIVLGKPFYGSNWVATGALSPTSYHRRAALILDNKIYLAQRYAIDWVQICPDGQEVKGDLHENKNWIGDGTVLLAVRDGVITKVHQGLKSNTPPGFPPGKPASIEAVPGNHVILKIMEGKTPYYVLYAHMEPGSIKVKEGDQVKEGQILGLLGNTGNSTQPHLHIHVADSNHALKAEGVPAVFKDAKWIGQAKIIDSDYGVWKPFKGFKPVKFDQKLPLENQVFKFTQGQMDKCKFLEREE